MQMMFRGNCKVCRDEMTQIRMYSAPNTLAVGARCFYCKTLNVLPRLIEEPIDTAQTRLVIPVED